jgi:hypothetical protein
MWLQAVGACGEGSTQEWRHWEGRCRAWVAAGWCRCAGGQRAEEARWAAGTGLQEQPDVNKSCGGLKRAASNMMCGRAKACGSSCSSSESSFVERLHITLAGPTNSPNLTSNLTRKAPGTVLLRCSSQRAPWPRPMLRLVLAHSGEAERKLLLGHVPARPTSCKPAAPQTEAMG